MQSLVLLRGFCVGVFAIGGWSCGSGPPPLEDFLFGDAQVKATIEEYVNRDIGLREAFFLRDPRDGSVLELTFDHIHETVHTVGDSSRYACVDFKDQEGKVYDVDVYVRNSGDVARLVLHKVNGQAVVQSAP